MSKKNQSCPTVAEYLRTLEDETFSNAASVLTSLDGLKATIDDGRLNDPKDVQAVFDALTNRVKDVACLPQTISALSSLLRNAKLVECIAVPDLQSSAISCLHIIKELLKSCRTGNLKQLCYETFLAFPRDVVGAVITDTCQDVLEIIQLRDSTASAQLKFSNEVYCFLIKLLKVLTPEEKNHFIKEGLPIWFSDLIPAVMISCLKGGNNDVLLNIECLETITETLVHLDYFDSVQWRMDLLPCLYNFQKYPLIMKNQLETGSSTWHRLWIVFVKLLKNRITQNYGSFGTPINALLPVVELAFKMDVENRCRAFECWKHLMDNFFNETNESCLPKRIKLLLLPLKLNNAKVEATALAKLNTWWHLIKLYRTKEGMNQNDSDALTLQFIHFIFGKQPLEKKIPNTGMGDLYDSVKREGLAVFAKILGHPNHDSSSTTDLKKKLTSNQILAFYFNDWMFALKQAIRFTDVLNKKSALDKENMAILDIWKSFLNAIVDMPANKVRRDMFDGLIEVLHSFEQTESTSEDYPSDVIFELVLTLCKDNKRLSKILINTDGEDIPLHKVMTIILNPGIRTVLQRHETEKLSMMIKPLTDLIVNSVNVDWLLQKLTPNNTTIKIWTALALSVKESKTLVSQKTLTELLMWPVKHMHLIGEDMYSALTWYRITNLDVARLCKTELDKDIIKLLTQENSNETKYFRLCITICLFKYKMVCQPDTLSLDDTLLNMFQSLTSNMSEFKELRHVIPLLVDTVVVMLSNIESKHIKDAAATFDCVNNVQRAIFLEFQKRGTTDNSPMDDEIFVMLKNIFNSVDLVNKTKLCDSQIVAFVEELKQQQALLNEESSLYKFLDAKTNVSLSTTKSLSDNIGGSINKQSNSVKTNSDKNTETSEAVKEFTSPNVKKVVKKVKTKETNIVNTVEENGEVYVVVNTNWKFNPKRLTENQKEKLQRKREDIPALYQDLSQSQDEFRLSSWKTDSQDTTSNSTNSKSEMSVANEKASNILKNMPSSDVVPKIMENMFSDNLTREYDRSNVNSVSTANLHGKKERLSLSSPKSAKSPRMALKDRVLRNVRNLTEKSTTKNYTNVCVALQTENIPKTPTKNQIDNANLVINSAPSLMPERPSRVKRKPKKFDDVKLFGLKKMRKSENEQSDSDTITCDTNNLRNCENDDTINTETCTIPVDNIDKSVNEEITEQSVITEITEDVAVVQKDIAQTLEVTPIMHQEQKKITIVTPVSEENCDIEMFENNNQEKLIRKDLQKIATNCDIQDCQKSNNVVDNTINDESAEKTAENGSKVASQKAQISEVKEVAPKKPKIREIKILAIDTVEGNPFLLSPPTSRLRRKSSTSRLRRKALGNKESSINSKSDEVKYKPSKTKRDSSAKSPMKSQKSNNSAGKLDKSKTESISPKTKNNSKDSNTMSSDQESVVTNIEETQESNVSSEDRFEDAPCSEDVIESSQDSTFTTISAKSAKATPKRLPIVPIQRLDTKSIFKTTQTQDLLPDSNLTCDLNQSEIRECKDDIELPQNKTAESSKNQSVLTENMDTEPATEETIANDVNILIDDTTPITISSEVIVGTETQELAEANTQPIDPDNFMEAEPTEPIENTEALIKNDTASNKEGSTVIRKEIIIEINTETSQPIAPPQSDVNTDVCSPFKEDTQRKQDFLNNTSEISPIKLQSPDRETVSPSREETSSDYLVVTLSSPVQSNGEPFDKGSPEIFTEDKISPTKRDQSPPRADVAASSGGSPSSSLSLKKNRPQAMRAGGRAAHMLGLCVPESLKTIKISQREPEEPKKGNTSTPARRNLRVLYNAVGDNSENSGDKAEPDNFLKFNKDLPSVDSSPAVPILKRKLADIVDDVTASPASKRKRVSFHDPPISSTISVSKYIECKSPSSASKLDRMMRSHSKSPKRLDNTFVKLDTILCKAVESFKEDQADSLNDTNASLDVTPAVDVIVTSELNDTDPISKDLVLCSDSIENIAVELSSPAMKDLFIKEMQGKVDTIGDLAKMTEIEVNRLSIKAPKIQVAKKVLTDYAIKLKTLQDAKMVVDDTVLATEINVEMTEPQNKFVCVETQSDAVSVFDTEVQTVNEIKDASSQTTSGTREDLLIKHLEEITNLKSCEGMAENNLTENDDISNENDNEKKMKLLKDYISEFCNKKEIILFCIDLLKDVHDNTV